MPADLPLDAIFCERQGATYLVVNWRARRAQAAPAQLLQLSARHAERLREMRARGRSDLAVHHVLFLPRVRLDQLLPGPAPPRRADTAPPAPPAPAASAPPSARGRRAIRLGWGLSACLHLAALCVCCGIVWLMPRPDVPMPAAPQELLLPRAEPERAAAAPADPALGVPDAAAPEEAAASAPIQAFEVDTDSSIVEDADAPSMRPAAIGLPAAGSPGRALFMAARAASPSGPRGWQRRAAKLVAFGGNQASENAVDAALRWFRRSQGRDGFWDAAGESAGCAPSEGPPAATVSADAATVHVAMTGMALLCFLGAGYDQDTPSRYRSVVRAGLNWLLAQQHPDGYSGANNYSNGIAAMALCEAVRASHDPVLRAAAQRAVAAILAHQNRAPGPDGVEVGYGQRSGWDYIGPSERDDSSVTGWNLMALVSAREAGLDVGNGLAGVRDWFADTWNATNDGIGVPGAKPKEESRFPYMHAMGTTLCVLGAPNAPMTDLAGVGAVAAAFVPHQGSLQQLMTLANYIERVQLPRRTSINRYYLYYDTLAMFQLGDRWWSRWNVPMRDQLIATQRSDHTCYAGSWEAGTGGFCRTLATALCCLSLEVYYRYDRGAP